jgi:hypothetical protein
MQSGLGPRKAREDEPKGLGRPAIEGDRPVGEVRTSRRYPEYTRTREIRVEDGGTTLQVKILPDDR